MINHFQCHELDRQSYMEIQNVSLADQFGPGLVDVQRPKRLCNPADKNGEDPTAPTHEQHRLCYQVKQTDLVPFMKLSGAFVQDQFAAETLDVKKPALLCVPALTP